MTVLDLDQIRSTWLQQCGACDAGRPEYGCSHPADDHRPVMAQLVDDLARLRDAARRVVQLVNHNAHVLTVGAAIRDLRHALDGDQP